MSVKTKAVLPAPPPLTYPCLRRGKITNRVVLFTDSKTGVVVADHTHLSTVGHWSDSWAPADSVCSWEPVESVTLTMKSDMSIKTEAKVPAPKSANTFPILRRVLHTGDVVLFTSKHRGMVVHSGNDPANEGFAVGYLADDWGDCMDPNYWGPVESVTLTMED